MQGVKNSTNLLPSVKKTFRNEEINHQVEPVENEHTNAHTERLLGYADLKIRI